MKQKFIIILLCSFLFLFSGLRSQTIRGLYVDGFSSILGVGVSEDSLLNYAQFNGFNYLALYDLWPIHVTYNLTNASTCAVLANFIQRAKQNFGILQVGAIGENYYFFNNVIKIYNQQHSNPLQKFDVYNVEFEFWNTGSVSSGNYYCTTYLQPGGYTCDTAGAFSYYYHMIHQVDSLAALQGVISETYVGWFNQGQAVAIGNTADRILLHDYISNYSGVYSYVQQRLQYIAARNIVTNVIPIFSAEPAFMGPWLITHNVYTPYTDLQTSLANETGNWKQYINLAGYQWFAYSFMPYNVVSAGVSNITESAIKIFPNPTAATLEIQMELNAGTTVTIEVMDMPGKVLYSSHNEGQIHFEKKIDCSRFVTGFYFVIIKAGDKIVVRKLMKE